MPARRRRGPVKVCPPTAWHLCQRKAVTPSQRRCATGRVVEDGEAAVTAADRITRAGDGAGGAARSGPAAPGWVGLAARRASEVQHFEASSGGVIRDPRTPGAQMGFRTKLADLRAPDVLAAFCIYIECTAPVSPPAERRRPSVGGDMLHRSGRRGRWSPWHLPLRIYQPRWSNLREPGEG
jgi:hypothetical protein